MRKHLSLGLGLVGLLGPVALGLASLAGAGACSGPRKTTIPVDSQLRPFVAETPPPGPGAQPAGTR